MTGTDNIRFSGHTLDKATKAKVTLENFYTNLITQHYERKQRFALHTFVTQIYHHASIPTTPFHSDLYKNVGYKCKVTILFSIILF